MPFDEWAQFYIVICESNILITNTSLLHIICDGNTYHNYRRQFYENHELAVCCEINMEDKQLSNIIYFPNLSKYKIKLACHTQECGHCRFPHSCDSQYKLSGVPTGLRRLLWDTDH